MRAAQLGQALCCRTYRCLGGRCHPLYHDCRECVRTSAAEERACLTHLLKIRPGTNQQRAAMSLAVMSRAHFSTTLRGTESLRSCTLGSSSDHGFARRQSTGSHVASRCIPAPLGGPVRIRSHCNVHHPNAYRLVADRAN
jgi:hypothetical protein